MEKESQMDQLPLNKLKENPNNVRQVSPDKARMEQLLASIKSQGLLHNLVVTKNGKGYNILDGNRRYSALCNIYGKDSEEKINVIIVDNADVIKNAGLHANMMREDMHPLDECEAINNLCKEEGEDYDSIALKYGRTQKWVMQRVGLAELCPLAKQMFRERAFGLGVAQALTIGSHKQQKAWLEEKKKTGSEHFDTDNCKFAMLNKKILVSEVTKGANKFKISKEWRNKLEIESDLFHEEEYITNLSEFNNFINESLERYREKLIAIGFKDVIVSKYTSYYDTTYYQNHTYDIVYPTEETITHKTKFTYQRYEQKNKGTFPIGDVICYVHFRSHLYNFAENFYLVPCKELTESKANELEGEEKTVAIDVSDLTKPQWRMYKSYEATAVQSWLNDQSFEYKKHLMMAALSAKAFRPQYSYGEEDTSIKEWQREHFYLRDIATSDFSLAQIWDKEDIDDPYNTINHQYYNNLDNEHRQDAITHNKSIFARAYDKEAIKNLYKLADKFIFTIEKNVLCDETFQAIIGYKKRENWFRPSRKWLNKYKMNQLADYYIGLHKKRKNIIPGEEVLGMKRQELLNAILKTYQEHPDCSYDPLLDK